MNCKLTAKTDERLTESLDRTLNVHMRRVTIHKHESITNIVINNIGPNKNIRVVLSA